MARVLGRAVGVGVGVCVASAVSHAQTLFDYGGVYTVRVDDKALEEFRHEARVMARAPGWRQIDVAVKQVQVAGEIVDNPEFEGVSAAQVNPLFGGFAIPPMLDIQEFRFELGESVVVGVETLAVRRELTFESMTFVMGDGALYTSGPVVAASLGSATLGTPGAALGWVFDGPILFEAVVGESDRTVELEMGTFTTVIVPAPAGVLVLGGGLGVGVGVGVRRRR